MAFSLTCLMLQRVLIPVLLILAALIRPVGISFVYLLMFFITPFVPIATTRNFKGSVTAYLIILLALSTILILCHIALQVTIIALDLNAFFGACSFTEQLLRHIGFIDFRNLNTFAIIEWLVPETVVFVTSLTVYLVIKRLMRPIQLEDGEPDMAAQLQEDEATEIAAGIAIAAVTSEDSVITPDSNPSDEDLVNIESLQKIAPFLCLACLLFAAVLRPSVPGGFYYLVFLGCGTYWATFQTLQSGFGNLLRLTNVVIVAHSLAIVTYQMPYMQAHLDEESLVARLIGLEPLLKSTCENDIRIISYDTSFKWDSYLNPIVLFLTYYTLALSSKFLTKSLMRHNTRKALSTSHTDTENRLTGGEIPLQRIDSETGEHFEEEMETTVCDQIWYGIVSIGGFIYQNSYIFTNILMMAWSIVYHSWLTFLLLLWANVLWMIPNQRQVMMKFSPLIVLYTELLLIAQYIYSMDLHNDELPSEISEDAGIKLSEIGFIRPEEGELPCIPLVVKTIFVLMFWVTLRQFCKEKAEKRRTSSIADMMTPIQLGMSQDFQRPDKKSKFLEKAGDIIKNLLVRLWIWLLILIIFICAITGKHMTAFRIMYMSHFLFFLLIFQTSSKIWIKIMYGYWLCLIFDAMSILIIVYTYQFEGCDDFLTKYINWSKEYQKDLGLERYKTKDLFVQLLSPTLIVILTVIQLHYFHHRLVESLKNPPKETIEHAKTEPSTGSTPRRRTSPGLPLNAHKETTDFKESLHNLLHIFIKKFNYTIGRIVKHFKNVFWRFMELHLIKAVYISAFVCSVSEKSVLHIIFVALCLLGVISRVTVQTFISRIISFVVAILILAKMCYQVSHLDHTKYDVTCNATGQVVNDAEWFGLKKATSENGGLIVLLRKYIIYMVIVTLHAVVRLRQYQMRSKFGSQNSPLAKVLFPSVKRADAEKNLEGMIKYLLNYGYFKFGLEISLIALVTTITYRQDVIAIAYAVWLFVLLLFDRSKCARVWSLFQCFIATIIFLQYIFLVGWPPGFCITYPWEGTPYATAAQSWAMLPGHLNYKHISKLIFDFILLLLVNRQKRVFNIEARYHGTADYPGGTNSSVVHDIANLGKVPFQNPTRDFLSHIRNYLDIFKNIMICGFFWVTLAVVFLAGTNLSDFLALGYLVGAFVFLWHGSDFYLRPINTIIRRWNWLITYNVANILLKTCLQMSGCMFMQQLTSHCCWLVHLLGITCVSMAKVHTETIEHLETLIHKSSEEATCPPTTTKTLLIWDAVCFAFLLFQLRIFKSHYFCHIIIDTKANSMLATRGAEIIEDLRQRQIEHRQVHENQVLTKIKRKMEKIRATQQRLIKPTPTHYDEYGNPIPGQRIVHRRHMIKLHPQAVRAGDYYMFEDMDEKFELDVIEDEVDFLEDQDKITESEKKMNRRKTMIALDPKLDKSRDSEASTSQEPPTEEPLEEIRPKTELTPEELAEKQTDEELEANPIVRLLEAFMVSLTIRLNRFSRNYRYVNKILAEEKKTLKESKALYRMGPNYWRRHLKKKRELESASTTPSKPHTSTATRASVTAPNETDITTIQTPLTTTETTTTTITETEPTTANNELLSPPLQQSQAQLESTQVPHVIDIIESPSDIVDANVASKMPGSIGSLAKADTSEFVFEEEDFTSRDHNIFIEILISSWYAILANTDLICYIVVFINQVVNASIISLPLPLMVFLWATLSLPRPTKTFWVTLIAYTQTIVFIKCIFQYKLIWSNYINLPNEPLTPAKIFGVEMNPHYASYDLLLLLVLFFHRFILKSQGLWKSEYNTHLMKAQLIGETGGSIYALKSEESLSRRPTSERGSIDSNYSIEERYSNDRNGDFDAITDQNTGNNSGDPNADPNRDREQGGSERDKESHESYKYIAGIERLRRTRYFSSVRKFFHNLVHRARLPSDVYALMFLCDFINFFVLIFGFSAFGSQQTKSGDDGGVQSYLAENKVPIPFLIMLLLQFILIIIDRALYLRKALVFKIVFHYLSVIGIHVWMFFVVPYITERSFYSLTPPIIFYIFKCFNLLLSSYQIKCGYPKRILGNFLTKSFSLPNMTSYKIYMLIPFLFELRTVLDWMCTDTTMTIFDWLKMENIFSDIYCLKCTRQMETDFPAVRAQKKAFYIKFIMGGIGVLALVVLIWGPLCLFAIFNAVGTPNTPYEVSVALRLGPYDPIYTTSNRESIYIFNDIDFADMQNAFSKDRWASIFLSNYDAADIAAVKLATNSPSMWNISPPDKDRLLDDLKDGVPIMARLTYSFTRIKPSAESSGFVGSEVTYQIGQNFTGRKGLIDMLQGNSTSQTVVLPGILPKFIKVLNSGDLITVSALSPSDEQYRPLIINVHVKGDNIWWEINESCEDLFHTTILNKLPFVDCDSSVVLYTFNDKKAPPTFSAFTAGGIIGVYTTFVFVFSRVVKSFVTGSNHKIMFEDLPYVDRVLQLCLDIYLVREALEFELEEDLFAKLIFLYRSPETMIKWTRPKEEIVGDDTDTESSSIRRIDQQSRQFSH